MTEVYENLIAELEEATQELRMESRNLDRQTEKVISLRTRVMEIVDELERLSEEK